LLFAKWPVSVPCAGADYAAGGHAAAEDAARVAGRAGILLFGGVHAGGGVLRRAAHPAAEDAVREAADDHAGEHPGGAVVPAALYRAAADGALRMVRRRGGQVDRGSAVSGGRLWAWAG